MLKIVDRNTTYGDLAKQMDDHIKHLLETTPANKKQTLSKFREFVGESISFKFGDSVIIWEYGTIRFIIPGCSSAIEFKMKFKKTTKTVKINALKNAFLYEYKGIDPVNSRKSSLYNMEYGSYIEATKHAYDKWAYLTLMESDKNISLGHLADYFVELYSISHTEYYTEDRHKLYYRTDLVFINKPWCGNHKTKLFVQSMLFAEYYDMYQTGSNYLNYRTFCDLYNGICKDIEDKGLSFTALAEKFVEVFNLKDKIETWN